MRVLVTGGARSGKSRHAVGLLSSRGFIRSGARDPGSGSGAGHGYDSGPGHDDDNEVTFIAPGRPADMANDPDWAARVEHHRSHRPASWRTVESADVAGALRGSDGPVLVDCLGTWLTAVIDRLGLWDAPADEARAAVDEQVRELCAALATRPDVVLVTNEVGSGVVPAHRSGSLFRDLLGALNQAVGDACDEVHLVVCGRVLTL